jgi:carboxypeptidase Q
MNRRAILGTLAACGLWAALLAQPQVDPAASRQLAAAILDDGRSYEYVSELTSRFGSRLTGSPSYERAAEWAASQFRAAGLRRVAKAPFTIARGWERGAARGRIVSPIDQPLHVASLGWMPSTPEGGIEAEVVVVSDLQPEKIARQTTLKGRIALVAGQGGRDAAERFRLRQHLDERLRAAQAVAMISADSAADNVLAARSPGFGTEIGVLPSAQIGREDAALIRRLMTQGPVRLALAWHNQVTPGPVAVSNVVAEINGRERPDEFVIVGAHLDSWDFATGAQDNATGVAMVLDAARAIATLGRAPRRSIRFALWGGEEQGLLGSYAYVAAHQEELRRCVAAINTDGGSGRIRGFLTPGRPDVADAMRPYSQALLAGLAATGLDPSMRYAFQTDVGPFLLHGIPVLDLDPDEVPYEIVHHKSSDTIENVDRHDLAVGTAAIAVAAFALADAPEPIATHLDPAGVAAMLADARMDRVLQLRGVWQPAR